MATAKEIKSRIKSVTDTQKITSAMYLVACAKFRSTKDRLFAYRPYYNALDEQAKSVLSGINDNSNIYLDNNKPGKNIYLVIGSDKGLAGDYNKAISKMAIDIYSQDSDAEIYVIGNKIRKILESREIDYYKDFVYSLKKPDDDAVAFVSEYFEKLYLSDGVSSFSVIYTDIGNTIKTEVKCRKILPVPVNEEKTNSECEFLPSKEEIVSGLVPLYFKGIIRAVLLESFCSEQNARMNAMQSANTNAKDLLSDLKLQYNHQRQNAITAEITEISAERKKE